MGKFDEIIEDVVEVLQEAALINVLINTCIVFLILYFALSLINLFPLTLSLVFAMFYLMKTWIEKTDKYTARLVEKRFPFLKDKLTTAKDTLNQNNFIVTKLRIDVAKRLHKVDASAFFQMGRTTSKILIIILIIFSLMFVTVIDFRIFDAEKIISKIDLDLNFKGSSVFAGSGGTPGEGEYSGGDGLEFQVSQTVDVTDLQDVEEKKFKKEEFISYDELNAIGAQEYKDPITEEEKEIVKNYFNKLNQRE